MAKKINPLLQFRENRRLKREEARKKREREQRRALFVLGVVIVLLVPVFIVGIISERRKDAGTAGITSTEASSTRATADSDPAQSSAAEPTATDDEPREYDERHLQFGQTALFTTRAGGSSTPLEFTVSAPQSFKLTKNAILYDAASVGYPSAGKRQPTNVYFTVTVWNRSDDESWDADFLFSDVSETGDDDVISEVRDGDVNSVSRITDGQDLKPGKSATIKDGYSVKSADHIEYKLSVDGLAGTTFYFTQ